MDFVIVNGEIIKKQEIKSIPFFLKNPFILTQKFWYGYGGIPLFYENLGLIKNVLRILEIPIPDLLKTEHELFRLTKRMLNKNKYYRSGLVTIQISTVQNDTNIIVSSDANTEFDFPIAKSGLLLNFSEFEKYSSHPLNHLAFYNLPSWRFIDARNKNTSFQNSIILNDSGFVCESAFNNIFMVKGNTLITPHLDTGCYADAIRNHIMNIASDAGLLTEESKRITKEDILKMSELFLASEEFGIQWILGIGNKRFVNRHAAKIHEHINIHLEKLAQQ